MEIRVNGVVVAAALSFPGTGGWATWSTRSLTAALQAGTNVVRATATTVGGGPNVDRLDVTDGVTTPTATPRATPTATATATPTATATSTPPTATPTATVRPTATPPVD